MSRFDRLMPCGRRLVRGLACFLSAMACRPGLGQEKQLQVCDGPVNRLDPVRICGARLLDDGRVVPTTAWVDYQQHVSESCGSTLDCWDAFGNDSVSAPYGGVECGLPGQQYRWYFGASYVSPFYAANWNQWTDGHVGDATRVEFFWFTTNSDMSYYFLFTGRNQPGDCSYSVDYSGVAYDFGSVPPGASWADVDLEGTGLYHTLDPDGSGSYVGILADSWDGENVVLAQAQSMLWSANAASHGIPLAGMNHDIELDDDNPTDGRLDPEHECYSYAYGICPDPLQACVGFGNCNPQNKHCSGSEKLKATTSQKLGTCKVKLVLKKGLPNHMYKLKLPTGECSLKTTSSDGKAVFHEYPSASGTASIPACGVSVEVNCP